MARSGTTLNYQPKLDGIRAVAVLLVLENHFVTISKFTYGVFGVRLFFVLSGYLISRIIFEYRSKKVPLSRSFFHFYWRRTLRLYPPLLLVVLATAFLGLANMRQDWPWHLFYLTNVKVFLDESYGQAAPLWSLAVEEQFYLIWFPFLLLLPRRWLLRAILGAITIGVVFKVTLGPYVWIDMLLPANLDYLGLGALLAYGEIFRKEADDYVSSKFSKLWLLIALFCVMSAAKLGASYFYHDVENIISGVLAFGIISSAREKIKSIFFRFLYSRPLIHLGRISYGIYIYHYFVAEWLVNIGAMSYLKGSTGGRPLMLATEIAVTFGVAELSFVFVEKPLARLKTWSPWEPEEGLLLSNQKKSLGTPGTST
jgi:peptidoglycan/LPS O-acetylase OafA/YrhL